ncbi:multiheme c-type cytochrome [Caldithrix abyssi]
MKGLKFLCVCGFMLAFVLSTSGICEQGVKDTNPPYKTFSEATTECLECHNDVSSFVVNDWKRSKHYYNGVGCYECHKTDESNPAAYEHNGYTISTLVTPNQCASCHSGIVKEYQASIHSHSGLIAQRAEASAGGNFSVIILSMLGWEPDKIIHQKFWKDVVNDPIWPYAGVPKELQTENPKIKDVVKIFANYGCYSCHGTVINVLKKTKEKVVFDFRTWPMSGAGTVNPDGSIGSCKACHPFHSFSLRVARVGRGACGRCHESEDHPNYEMYGKSMHGAAFLSQAHEWNLDSPAVKAGRDYFAPTCATCHMGAVYQGDQMLYPPTHNPAAICKWKLGMWKLTFVRKAGEPHPALPSVKYPTNGIENRKRALAMCTQCHTKQWSANALVSGDLTMSTLDNFRTIALKIEDDLKAKGLNTPLDRKTVRDIGAMAVRPTEISMFHYAPGYVWWEGVYKVAFELTEWLENSVAPRLGDDYVAQYISWIKEHKEKVDEYRNKMHIK